MSRALFLAAIMLSAGCGYVSPTAPEDVDPQASSTADADGVTLAVANPNPNALPPACDLVLVSSVDGHHVRIENWRGRPALDSLWWWVASWRFEDCPVGYDAATGRPRHDLAHRALRRGVEGDSDDG